MICKQERAVDKVHSAQGEIADRPHSKVLFAGDTERAFRCANGCANFRQIERRIGVRFQERFKARDDRLAALTASGRYRGSALG